MTGRSRRNTEERARLNSLNLTSKKLEQVLDLLDSGTDQGRHADRVDSRWPFRQASIAVQIEHPGGSSAEVRMACRNLSRSGIGLLHSGFVYNGTRCVVSLPHPHHGEVPVAGEVVRCQHRGGVLHEVGVRFDHEINPRCYIRPNPLRELFAVERVDLPSLTGNVLCIEPNALDAQLLKHFLRETKINLRLTADYDQAVEIARAGVDLILSVFRIGESTCEDLAMLLRAENIDTPILLCSNDFGGHVLELIDGRRVQAYIRKPLDQEKAARALAEFLTGEQGNAPSCGADADGELIRALRPELVRCAKAIEKAVERNQPMEVLGTCMQLQSSAGSIGLGELSWELDTVVGHISEKMEIKSVTAEISQIIKRCRAA